MKMSYYFSGTVYNFLFYGVNVVTVWGMVSLCLGLLSLSLLYEGFKVGRSLLQKVAVSKQDSRCRTYNRNERSPLLLHASHSDSEMQRLLYYRRIRFHILQTFLHIIQLTIGYMLMLAIMTYNAYFTFAVVGGSGLGYFCFALFDLPSKLLCASVPHDPTRCSAGTSSPHLSEGNNSSVYCASYGAAATVTSPIGSRFSSQLEQGSLGLCGAALTGSREHEPGRVAGTTCCSEGEQHYQLPMTVACGEDEVDGPSGVSAPVDVSDKVCLLPQDTIRVEVQVHAFPDGSPRQLT